MGKTKVYVKTGNLNWEERKLVDELRAEIDKRGSSDPAFLQSYQPALSKQELIAQHAEYCTTEAEFTEVKSSTANAENNSNSASNSSGTNTGTENPEKKVSPLLRDEPIVRDYVMDGGFKGDKKPDAARTNFDEPLTFADSFEMPDPNAKEEPKNTTQPKQEEKKEEPKKQPLNPAFDDMETAKQRKQTKRFAKSIVRITCALLERGIVWFATKDINEHKIAEYELNDEINMDLILSMDGQQDKTVRQFFADICLQVKQGAKFTEPEVQELADALADVFMEKGVAPTPMQALIATSIEVIGPKLLDAGGVWWQNRSTLVQLRTVTKREKQKNGGNPPRRQPPAQNNQNNAAEPETPTHEPEETDADAGEPDNTTNHDIESTLHESEPGADINEKHELIDVDENTPVENPNNE